MGNNTFINSNLPWGSTADDRGDGIVATNTNIHIFNSGSLTVPGFSGLKYGIRANFSSVIENNFFNNNYRGAFIQGSNSYAQVFDNTFIVGNNGNQGTPQTTPFGLGLKNCPAYEVEENTFKDGFVGMVMAKNPNSGTKVYLNTFDNLTHAFVANETNGLKLTCNDFGITTAPNIEHNIYMFNGKIFPIQDHAVYSTPFNPINTHNRFEDPTSWVTGDAHKFNMDGWTSNYSYYYGDLTDQTQIKPHPYDGITPNPLVDDIPTIHYASSMCPSQINGSKSVMNELSDIDDKKDSLVIRQNYYNSVVDNGNTQYYLDYIQNLKPNNFNTLYNQLMDNAPYISDTVLISFMIHPINKPSHKKNVVTACSPLPVNVRPYIDQMNINQNFKNQLWALQNGTSPRVLLENELANREFGINGRFIDLLISTTLVDTIPEKVDTLLNYVLQSGDVSERIITSPVFIEKERYSDAQSNLNEIVNLSYGDEQIQNFIDIQQLQMQLKQAADSLRESILAQNEWWLWNIADDSANFCQSDAISLLEELNDTLYPFSVYIGNSYSAKLQRLSKPTENEECLFDIYPNPTRNVLNIVLKDTESLVAEEITVYDIKGVLVMKVSTPANEKIVQVNVSKWLSGKYFVHLQNSDGIQCVKSFVVN